MAIGLTTAIVGSAILGVGASLKAGSDAKKAASAAQDYNNAVAAQNAKYRLEVMDWGNDVYESDIAFYEKNVAYQRDEFDKMKGQVTQTVDAVNKNMFAALATQATRIIEQDIAATLGMADISRQVQTETGAVDVAIAEANIGGNTAKLLRGEIERQGGEAKMITGMNADSARKQSVLEMKAIKASRDTQLAGITIPSFAPIAPPQAPSPVSPTAPAAPVARPSTGAIVLNAAATGINLATGAQQLFGR